MGADVLNDGYIRFVVGLLAVLAMIVVAVWIAKRLGLGTTTGFRGKGRRLSLVEVMPLDQKRKLVLVRHDETDHLILLGAAHETLLSSGAAPIAVALAPTPIPERDASDKGRKNPFLAADREA
jgi:flagellar protein FliO/FliZ